MRRLSDYTMQFFRVCIGGDAIMSWYNSVYEPGSALYQIGKTQDGSILLLLLAIIGGAIILDVLVNDLTPEYVRIGRRQFRITWHRAFKCRHLLFIGLAFCYAAQPYVAEKAGQDVSLTGWLYWKACQCIVLAFIDAKLRSRSIMWQRAFGT